MKRILALLLAVIIPASAFADACSAALTGPSFTASQAITICNKFPGLLTTSFIPASATPSVDIGSAAKPIRNEYHGAGGFQDIYPAAAVITPSTSFPTPSAGNTLTQKRTILAAGAPTAAYVVLPAATSSVGKGYTLFNQGSNPVAIVPSTGVINVDAALTPFACTTLKECECTGTVTGGWWCSQK